MRGEGRELDQAVYEAGVLRLRPVLMTSATAASTASVANGVFDPGSVTFHVEAAHKPRAVARDIRKAGARAGVAVKPGTPLSTIEDLLPLERAVASQLTTLPRAPRNSPGPRISTSSTRWAREPAIQSSAFEEWWMAWKRHIHGTT